MLVIKRNGNREEFSREKLLNGLVRSAEKRPVSLGQLENIVNEIERSINQEGENEVSSTLIGEMVMDHLAKIDDIAYIRFASVYRQFTDRKMFLKELERMSMIMDSQLQECTQKSFRGHSISLKTVSLWYNLCGLPKEKSNF